MLRSLQIQNYALIEHLEIDWPHGFSTLTGETGAGKSILLGALHFLAGQRADAKVLMNPEEKCFIEAVFENQDPSLVKMLQTYDIEEDTQYILRRQLSPNGRSRAFINDIPVTLEVMKLASSRLFDIHSQHDNILLSSEEYQRKLLDAFASSHTEQESYRTAYTQFRTAEKAYRTFVERLQQLKKDSDYQSFQLRELQAIPLDQINQEQLSKKVESLDNQALIKETLTESLLLLRTNERSIENEIHYLVSKFQKISNFQDIYKDLLNRLESISIEIKDITQVIESENQQESISELEADKYRRIQSQLFQLQQKHQCTDVETLINLRNTLQKELQQVENSDEELQKLKDHALEAKNNLLIAAKNLSAKRKEVIPSLCAEIINLLLPLGLPHAKVDISIQAAKPEIHGADQISFVFSANKGVEPRPLKEVASGGELSRLILVLKYLLAGRISMPTLFFDEIDTGISGEISLRVGQMMHEMAESLQLIVITHQPQIAAKASNHFFVYKDHESSRTISKIKKLTSEERLREIAQMIGGEASNPLLIQSAKQLMGITE